MDAAKSLRDHGVRIGDAGAGADRRRSRTWATSSVGHVTVVRDEPDPPDGRGAARSGVTAVVPAPLASLHAEPLAAGIAVLNGAGELTGSLEVAEWGELATPVYLTATMSVGRVYDGAVAAAVAADPRVGVDDVVIPVVGECDDSWLNDARVVQVEADDVSRALADAEVAAEVVEGAVGAGTGMVCFDWKGGIGSSSRRDRRRATRSASSCWPTSAPARSCAWTACRSAALLGGRPGRAARSGRELHRGRRDRRAARLRSARRASRGARGSASARTGSVAHHGSGEIFVAFSTTTRAARDDPRAARARRRRLDPLFRPRSRPPRRPC